MIINLLDSEAVTGKPIPIESFLPKKDYISTPHCLKMGKKIEIRRGSVDEHLFFYSGSFSIFVDFEYKAFTILPSKVLHIKIPAGASYDLFADSDVSYEIYKG